MCLLAELLLRPQALRLLRPIRINGVATCDRCSRDRREATWHGQIGFWWIFSWFSCDLLGVFGWGEICWDVWMAHTQWDNIADSKTTTVSVCTTTYTSCTGCMTESASGSEDWPSIIPWTSPLEIHHSATFCQLLCQRSTSNVRTSMSKKRYVRSTWKQNLHPSYLCQRKDM